MNTKSLIALAIENRQKQETTFRKKYGEGVLSDIARDSGITYSTLLNWKNGNTEANFSNLRAVMNACGLDFEVKKRVEL